MTDTLKATSRPVRRRRRWLVLLAVVCVLLVLVALLPTILSGTVMRGMVAQRISSATGFDAEVRTVRLRWLSAQVVGGVRLREPDGTEVADVDIRLDQGLFGAARGVMSDRHDLAPLHVVGSAQGSMWRDGAVGLGTRRPARPQDRPTGTREPSLEPGGEPGGKPGREPSAPRDPDAGEAVLAALAKLSELPKLSVLLGGVDLTLQLPEDDERRAVRVRGLRGALHLDALAPGGSIQASLDSDAGPDVTRVQVTAYLSGFHGGPSAGGQGSSPPGTRRSALTPHLAAIDVQITIDGLAVPYAADVPDVERASLRVGSAALGERVLLELSASGAEAEGSPAMRVHAVCIVRGLIDAAGAVHLDADRVEGTVSALSFPLPLLQPFVAETGLQLAEDLGVLADVEAVLAPPDSPDSHQAGARTVSAQLSSPRLTAEVSGSVRAGGAVRDGNVTIDWTPSPDSLERLSDGRLRGAPKVMVRGSDLLIHAAPGDGTGAEDVEQDFAAPRGRLQVTVDGMVEAKVEVTEDIAGDPIELEADGEPGGSAVRVAASTVRTHWIPVEQISADVTVTDGEAPGESRAVNGLHLDLRAQVARSTTTVTGYAEVTAQSLRSGPFVLVMEVDPELLALVRGTLAEQGAAIDEQRSGPVNGPVDGDVDGDVDIALDAPAAPAIALARPAELRMELAPLDVEGNWRTADAWQGKTIAMALTSDRVGLLISGIEPAVDLGELHVALIGGVRDGNRWAEAEFRADVSYDDGARRLLSLTGAAEMIVDESAGDEASPGVRGHLNLETVRLRNVERLLDMTPQSLVERLGNNGFLRTTFEVPGGSPSPTGPSTALIKVRLEPGFPRLTGDLPLTLHDERIVAKDATLAWTLGQDVIQAWLDGPEGDDPSGMRSAGDAVLHVTLSSATLPLAMVRGEAIDPADAGLVGAITLTRAAWTLAAEPQQPYSMETLTASLNGPSLASGMGVDVAGTIRDLREPIGDIALSGRVRSLFADGLLDPASATVTMEGSVRAVPAHVLDRLLEMNGFLTAAIGDTLTATLAAQNLSRTRGTLDLDVRSPASTLAVRLHARENLLLIRPANPLTGELELTPALRARLLEKVHPIFADVRTVEQPIRVRSVDQIQIPTDGDPSRLNGRLEITVGNVEFDGGSSLLAVFALFDRAGQVDRIKGSIDPIDVRIRRGVIDYERFSMKVDRLELVHRGQINLVNQTADLRMEVPLSQIAHGVSELEGIADKISVPIVTRGPLRDLRTRIDPDFDMGKAALDAGLRRGLDELIGPGRTPLGGLLDDLLNRRRRPE